MTLCFITSTGTGNEVGQLNIWLLIIVLSYYDIYYLRVIPEGQLNLCKLLILKYPLLWAVFQEGIQLQQAPFWKCVLYDRGLNFYHENCSNILTHSPNSLWSTGPINTHVTQPVTLLTNFT